MAALWRRVRYFRTAQGRPAWNQPGPPFQAKTRPETTPGSTTWACRTSTTTSSSSSTSTIIRPRNTSTARSATSTIRGGVGAGAERAATSNAGPRGGLAEQDVVLQGPLQMGFYGHNARRSSSARTPRTGPSAGASAASSRPARRGPPRHGRARRRRAHRRVRARIIATGEGPRTWRGPISASSSRGRTRWCRSSCSTRRAWCAGTRPGRRSSSSWPRAGTRCGRCRSVLWVLPVVALLRPADRERLAVRVPGVQPRRRPRRDADVALEPAGSSRPGSG